MKTLDEVIKAKELCELNCSDEEHCQDCPYAKQDANGDWSFFCHECEFDALHYLRFFRDMEDELNDIRREYIEQMKNSLLTWDELKTMEGKPVWLEDKDCYGRWEIITGVYDDGISFGDYFLSKDEFDTTWQAYRKEKK